MAIEFRSRTFAYSSIGEDELNTLVKDAIIIQQIEEKDLPSIVNFAKNLVEAKTKEAELEIHNGAIGQVIPNRQTGISAHRFCNCFFRVFCAEDLQEDSPEEIAGDLNQLGVENQEKMANFLKLIKQETAWYKEYRLKKAYNKGLFPYLDSVGTTIELRGVFNREMSGKEKYEDYIKEVEIESNTPLLPVISVSVTLDSGDPDRFVFQASPENIELLIERLKAALHKSKMLVNFFEGK